MFLFISYSFIFIPILQFNLIFHKLYSVTEIIREGIDSFLYNIGFVS